MVKEDTGKFSESYQLAAAVQNATTVEVYGIHEAMNEETPLTDPREIAQRIALGVHSITDRFSAHEESFAQRLKESALELIEQITLYEVARTRDAAGTARLIHRLIERTDALRQLLSFVKHRGLARSATVDNLDYEVGTLLQILRREDARFEEHVSRAHPQGHIVEAHPVPQTAPVNLPQMPTSLPRTQKSATSIPTKPSAPSQNPSPFDPLLDPDETIVASANPVMAPMTHQTSRAATSATALKEKTEVFLPTMQAAPAAPVVSTMPTLNKQQNTQPTATKEEFIASGGLTDRQRKILGLFDREKEAALKRVMEVLPMFSEKTLRNDLKDLVARGKITRTGKAPRSRYILTA